jgi:hypothetical protein
LQELLGLLVRSNVVLNRIPSGRSSWNSTKNPTTNSHPSDENVRKNRLKNIFGLPSTAKNAVIAIARNRIPPAAPMIAMLGG